MTRSDDRTATDPNKVDAIKLSLMIAGLRLPTINQLWQSFAKRDRRRIERHFRQVRHAPLEGAALLPRRCRLRLVRPL